MFSIFSQRRMEFLNYLNDNKIVEKSKEDVRK